MSPCGDKGEKDCRAYYGSDDLEKHVYSGILAAHPAAQIYAECYGRVYMASGYAAYRISHGHDSKPERKGYTEGADACTDIYRILKICHQI